jgi:outer membrane receptor for ferrienterochelin and colicin
VPSGTYVPAPFVFHEPLIVEDGVSSPRWPMDTAFQIPRRLSAIQLLRGAAAASYYGSRAVGGAIEIQTRVR